MHVLGRARFSLDGERAHTRVRTGVRFVTCTASFMNGAWALLAGPRFSLVAFGAGFSMQLEINELF